MSILIIRPRARIFHGHDWVYSSDILRAVGEPQPGDLVALRDQRDRTLGTAIYNPHSQIVARRISRRKQDLDKDFFVRRLERARRWREERGIDLSLCRLIWSESDGVPGVVVDVYGGSVVFQTNTLAMDNHRHLLIEAIQDALAPAAIIERNDSSSRKAEGLENRVGLVAGEYPGTNMITVNGLSFAVDLLTGQKTGFYLDQADNHAAVARLARGKRVLDCFCNQGGFALHCARAGAASVLGIDVSDDAVAGAAANAAANDLNCTFQAANVFDLLREEADKGERKYDLIILDPPSFTRNRKTVGGAMRGYKEIHLRALKLLSQDGYLATYTCSHHVSRQDYLDMIVEAAVDAPATLRLVESQTQRVDHPVLPGLPETEYLKGFVFQSIAAW